jgi:flagellar hook-associated protein 2
MTTPSISGSTLAGLGITGTGSNDLYTKVNGALLAKNTAAQQISTALNRDQTKLSGLGQLRSALASFQALAQSLGHGGLETAATASAPAILTAVTAGGAKPGNHGVEVSQLAQAQQLSTRGLAAPDTAIGNGAATTIKIDFGTTSGHNFTPAGKAVTLKIDASNNSLKGIASAFQSAGIDATVVRSGNSYALSITGKEGSQNSLRISVAGDASVQKLLEHNPSGSDALTQGRAAQDAHLTVDGKAVSSDSNVVTGVVTGVALALTKVGKTDVTVAQNADQIGKNVAQFVSSFNQLQGTLATVAKQDSSQAGLTGQIARQLNEAVASLSTIGVSAGANGALKLDTKALTAAINANASGVSSAFFNNGSGVADKVGSKLAQLLGTQGSLTQQADVVNHDIASLNKQQATVRQAVSAQTNALLAQYTQQSGATSSVLPGVAAGSSVLPGLQNSQVSTSLFDLLA